MSRVAAFRIGAPLAGWALIGLAALVVHGAPCRDYTTSREKLALVWVGVAAALGLAGLALSLAPFARAQEWALVAGSIGAGLLAGVLGTRAWPVTVLPLVVGVAVIAGRRRAAPAWGLGIAGFLGSALLVPAAGIAAIVILLRCTEMD